jgi:hypothetical protein
MIEESPRDQIGRCDRLRRKAIDDHGGSMA